MEVEEVLSVLPTLLAWAEGANQRTKDAYMAVVGSQPQRRGRPALRIAKSWETLGEAWGKLDPARAAHVGQRGPLGGGRGRRGLQRLSVSPADS